MPIKTNLRVLRHRHHLLLTDLEDASGLSNQYISRAELGQIQPTKRLETQLDAAIQAVIEQRKQELRALEENYLSCTGRLLDPAEGGFHEQ